MFLDRKEQKNPPEQMKCQSNLKHIRAQEYSSLRLEINWFLINFRMYNKMNDCFYDPRIFFNLHLFFVIVFACLFAAIVFHSRAYLLIELVLSCNSESCCSGN